MGLQRTAACSWLGIAAACAAGSQPSAEVDGPPRPALCARAGQDAVRDVFCAAEPRPIGSLLELQQRLGLQPQREHAGITYHNQPILLGHSTSLSGRLVSPINPRAFLVGSDVVLAFQRGLQRAELAARARDHAGFNLYLLSFDRACNHAAEGCSPADLYGPDVERSWTGVSLQDDEELKNTPSDCRPCHQRARPSVQLIMREVQSPWTHFFDALHGDTPGAPGVRGSDLMLDYVQAHGMESYGGVAIESYPLVAPFALERLAGERQPLLFDAPGIERERWPLRAEGYATSPEPSPTWERAYAAFKRGEQLALPYLEVRATDPDKQAQLTAAYARFAAGETGELPELSDIFPDDPAVRARIGLETEPDASPVEALIQACGSCHNDVLDQSLSRARFNVDLSRMGDAELDVAIERLERDGSAPGAMPPPEARALTPAVRERLLAYLRGEARQHARVPELERASQLGMAREP